MIWVVQGDFLKWVIIDLLREINDTEYTKILKYLQILFLRWELAKVRNVETGQCTNLYSWILLNLFSLNIFPYQTGRNVSGHKSHANIR